MKSSAFDNFSEEALEVLDFAKCQRADGSVYGTAGSCVTGKPVSGKSDKSSDNKKSGQERKMHAELMKLAPDISPKDAEKVMRKAGAKVAQMSPEEFNRQLKKASEAMVKQDRANPGGLRGRTPHTPSREEMGWNIKLA